MRSRILGTGSYVPTRVLTNADLEKMVATSDAWIVERTGIRERRLAAPGEACSDLGVPAARQALAAAKVPASALDLILVATCTGDSPLPSTASVIQDRLGAGRAAACDIAAACCGFVYALSVADAFVRTGARYVLVIGSEVMSAVTDWTDRNTCVLFGDGAGAVVVGPAEDGGGGGGDDGGGGGGSGSGDGNGGGNGDDGGGDDGSGSSGGDGDGGSSSSGGGSGGDGGSGGGHGGSNAERGILSLHLHADGKLSDFIQVPGGGSSDPPSERVVAERLHCVKMRGNETFKIAVKTMEEAVREAVAAQGLEIADIDWLVPHQANIRILRAVGQRLGLPPERVVINVDRFGNTSAASIPLALDEAVRGGAVQPGQVVVMAAFGAGLTWASGVMRW